MEIIRKSSAVWQGSGKEGKGSLSSQSGILNETRYGFQSRFADGPGTNPEELIAAAHAGCFTMKLAFNLQAENFIADEIQTECKIVLENGQVTRSELKVAATVPNLSDEKFATLVLDAKENCPISKLLNCEVNIEYELK